MNCDEECATNFHFLYVLVRFYLMSTPSGKKVIKRGCRANPKTKSERRRCCTVSQLLPKRGSNALLLVVLFEVFMRGT